MAVLGGMFLVMPTSRMSLAATSSIRSLSMRLKIRGPLSGSRPRNRLREIDSWVTSAESW